MAYKITSQQMPTIKESALMYLDADITTLFEMEDFDSPVLRQVAFSMWDQCMKLYEEGVVKPQHDFVEIDEFIRFIKSSGVPEEIRGNQEHMLKVLGAGFDTFIDEVDIDSPLLRKVSYGMRQKIPFLAQGDFLKPLSNKPMPEDQLVEAVAGHCPPELPGLKQHVEKYNDTIFWSVDAPEMEGKCCCGVPVVVLGLVKPTLKFCVIDSYLPKMWLEALVKHPVEVDLVDSPIVREGATSCDIRIHLRPSAYTYKKDVVF